MIKKVFCLFTFIIILTGCDIKTNTMDDITIYTTNYASEYITQRLYGDHSTIYSIYPDGVDIKNYKLTSKQIKDYSNSDLYIFNGLNASEKKYVTSMRQDNKNLKIIDDTLSMAYTNGVEELWLDPSNFLMIAQNIKNGFSEYIDNYYLNNDISNNYEQLKVEASNLDVKIKQTVSNAENTNIIASSDMFKYLEKYGLTVYSLEGNVSSKTMESVEKLMKKGEIQYIFIKDEEEINGTVKDLMNEYKVKTVSWNTLSNLSENERNNNQDYFTIMNENISLLRDELYE